MRATYVHARPREQMEYQMTEVEFREKLIEAMHDHLSWMRELCGAIDEIRGSLASQAPQGHFFAAAPKKKGE